jgi:hypothetical protein
MLYKTAVVVCSHALLYPVMVLVFSCVSFPLLSTLLLFHWCFVMHIRACALCVGTFINACAMRLCYQADEFSPLFVASANGHAKTVAVLLAAGASVTAAMVCTAMQLFTLPPTSCVMYCPQIRALSWHCFPLPSCFAFVLPVVYVFCVLTRTCLACNYMCRECVLPGRWWHSAVRCQSEWSHGGCGCTVGCRRERRCSNGMALQPHQWLCACSTLVL